MKRSVKREENLNRLLDSGVTLFVNQGYHGTGIQEIVNEAQLPKGSFYTYFDSKEFFGAAVIDSFTEQGMNRLDAIIAKEDSPLVALRSFFETNRDHLVKGNFKGGCLLGNLSNELESQLDAITPHLLKGLEAMSSGFTALLETAQQEGLVRKDLPPSILGDLLLNGWEGALIRAKMQSSATPIDQFLHSFFEVLLKP